MTATETPLSSPPSKRQNPERGPYHQVESSNKRRRRYSQSDISGAIHLHTARKSPDEQLALNSLPNVEGEESRGESLISHESVTFESLADKVYWGLLRDATDRIRDATDRISQAVLLKRSVSRDQDARGSKPPYHPAFREHADLLGLRSHHTPKPSHSAEAQSLDTHSDDHGFPDVSEARDSILLADILLASAMMQIQRLEDMSNDSGEVQRGLPNVHTAFPGECIESKKSPPVEPTANPDGSSVAGTTRAARAVYPTMPVVERIDATTDYCATCSSDKADQKRPIIQAAVSPNLSDGWVRVMVMLDSGSPWSLIAEETVLRNVCLKAAYRKYGRPKNAPPNIAGGGRTLKVLGHLSRLVLNYKGQHYEVKKVLVLEPGVFQHSNLIVGSDSMKDDLGGAMVTLLKPAMSGASESRQEAQPRSRLQGGYTGHRAQAGQGTFVQCRPCC